MVRHAFVWLHRWIGLIMVAVLVIEGLTGSLLAFRIPITRWLQPELFATAPYPGARQLSLADLAEAAERLVRPKAAVAYFFDGSSGQAIIRCGPTQNPATGKPYDIDFDEIVLDPWTGRELGRLPGHPHGFAGHFMPIVYSLHTALAIGSVSFPGNLGGWILGVTALLWTLDCFWAFYLTLPLRAESFWRRWKIAWNVKWRSSAIRVNYDLHRAGGLWMWLLLFVFAWSSVELTLSQVYEPVTSALFDYQSIDQQVGDMPRRAQDAPRLGWHAAQQAGDRIIAQRAAIEGFRVEYPSTFAYFSDNGLYSYSVRTNRSFPAFAEYNVYFDSATGALYRINPSSGVHAGNTISNWLYSLHLARDPVDNVTYRAIICLVGLVTAMLSVTGVYIWWKKRRASQASYARLVPRVAAEN